MILSPTTQIGHHHKVTNITMSPTSLSAKIQNFLLYRAYGTQYHAEAIFRTVICSTATASDTTLIWWRWYCCWWTCIRLITTTSSGTKLRKLSFFSEFEQKMAKTGQWPNNRIKIPIHNQI